MSGFVVIVVDGGCWTDPAVYGPYTSEDEAVDGLVSHMPTMQPPDDEITSWHAGDTEALIVPMAAAFA